MTLLVDLPSAATTPTFAASQACDFGSGIVLSI